MSVRPLQLATTSPAFIALKSHALRINKTALIKTNGDRTVTDRQFASRSRPLAMYPDF